MKRAPLLLRRGSRSAFASTLFATATLATLTVSGDTGAQETPIRELRYDLGADLSVSIGTTLAIIAIEYEKTRLTPAKCRVCSRATDGTDTLNGVDSFFHHALALPNARVPNVASYLTGFVAEPIGTFATLAGVAAHDHAGHGTPVDLLLVYEATSIAGVIDEVTKVLVARERPFVHFSPDPSSTDFAPDSRLSFYSGHTTGTFAIATAAGTIASLRGYSQAPLVWITGLSLASLTGYLRMAAARHYMTDVLVGAAMGALVGFTVPYVFHRALNGSIESPVTGPSATIGSPGLVQIGGRF